MRAQARPINKQSILAFNFEGQLSTEGAGGWRQLYGSFVLIVVPQAEPANICRLARASRQRLRRSWIPNTEKTVRTNRTCLPPTRGSPRNKSPARQATIYLLTIPTSETSDGESGAPDTGKQEHDDGNSSAEGTSVPQSRRPTFGRFTSRDGHAEHRYRPSSINLLAPFNTEVNCGGCLNPRAEDKNTGAECDCRSAKPSTRQNETLRPDCDLSSIQGARKPHGRILAVRKIEIGIWLNRACPPHHVGHSNHKSPPSHQRFYTESAQERHL